MRIVVSGGNGLLGRKVVADLAAAGHDVLSLDQSPHPEGHKPSWSVDLRNPGDVYQACADAHALVHLAAFVAPELTSDTNTFNTNVSLTYNCFKAASEMGIRRVVVASSIGAYGYLYGPRGLLPKYLPLDESHPCIPSDPYGLSKLVGEQIADSFARSGRISVISLRFPGINFDPEYTLLKQRQAHPEYRTRGFWSYIDARDATRACRVAVEAESDGHRIYNTAAPKSNMREPTAELVARFLPGLRDIRPGPEPNWSGIDSGRIERELGFRAEHDWQDSEQR